MKPKTLKELREIEKSYRDFAPQKEITTYLHSQMLVRIRQDIAEATKKPNTSR